MIVGGEKIIETAQKVLANIEEAEIDELCEIDEVFVIVAAHYGTPDLEEDAEAGELFYRCTSARQHVQFGLLIQAHRAVEDVIRREND